MFALRAGYNLDSGFRRNDELGVDAFALDVAFSLTNDFPLLPKPLPWKRPAAG
jgi:hypothetical protein